MMDDKTNTAQGGCTHNCSTCGPDACEPKKKGLSFFGTLGAISDHTDKMNDEELMQMLQNAVDEWEES